MPARKTTPQVSISPAALFYSFDAGNGSCKGISNERTKAVQFAPVIAPMTDKRALNDREARPDHSLRVDDQILVFGVDDVFLHGKRAAIRRLNSGERYLSPDYFRMLNVLFLKSFATHRGEAEYISPKGVISVPVSQFNNDDVRGEILETLVGQHVIEDYEGCTLRLDIKEKHLTIIPESTGAMTHYAFTLKNGEVNKRNDTGGTSLVIDIGYETTDVSLFEGMAYQRDASFTVPRAGMGTVARSITDSLRQHMREADVSRIDQGMRTIAGSKPGAPKHIEVAPGIMADVGGVYDIEIESLAQRIADEIRTQFTGVAARIILGGGGALHLARALDEPLSRVSSHVVPVPDPDLANVYGGYTLLQIKQAKGR